MKRIILILFFLMVSVPTVFADGEFPRKPYQSVWEFPEQFQTFLDYDVRTDSQPVYVGRTAKGVASSANNWTIYKMTYDESDRLLTVKVATGTWDDRASLTYE